MLRNPQVPDGGWEAAINRMAVSVEWTPDPPPAKLDLQHELLTEPQKGIDYQRTHYRNSAANRDCDYPGIRRPGTHTTLHL